MTAAACALSDPGTFVLALRPAVTALKPRGAFATQHAQGMQEPLSDPLAAQAERDAQLASLLQAVARGDAQAFEQFYNATVRQAMAVVRRVAGDAHAEDVLADCFFQAWRNAGQFDAARGSALAWLLTMARSRALDRMRQETLRHGGLSGAPGYDADACEKCPNPGPEQLLESTEASTRLHAALRQLSPTERWVLGLAYFGECTQSGIAAATGLPLGTVKSLMRRAQHKLRETLENGTQTS